MAEQTIIHFKADLRLMRVAMWNVWMPLWVWLGKKGFDPISKAINLKWKFGRNETVYMLFIPWLKRN